MANVVNRTKMPVEILYSVNTPDYPESEWIINPDLTILETVPLKYIKIVGDLLVEMTAEEKAAIDAAELAAYKKKVVADVCQARERKIDHGTGAPYPIGSTTNFIPCTDQDQNRWQLWAAIGGKWNALGLTFPFVVHSRDGLSSVTITRAQDFTGVLEAIAMHVTGLFSEAESIIMAVNAATTIQGVDTVSANYIATAPVLVTE